MALKTYDFKSVQVIWGGQILTGFAEGDSISWVEDSDSWTLQVGADGEQTRSKSNNRSVTVTMNLQQGSDANDILYASWQADQLSNSGLRPMLIKDNSGRTILSAAQAWVQKPADFTFGQEAGDRSWVIRAGSVDVVYGGN